MKEIFRFKVPEAENKKRLDEFLFDRLGVFSKMHLRRLLSGGAGKVNGAAEQPGFRLRKEDEIEIEVDLAAQTAMTPQPIPLDILFEDAEIIVVNKPAEMLVHPTLSVKTGTLLNALSYHLNKKNAENEKDLQADNKSEIPNPKSPVVRPGLIHRLDKKTSGLMVIAKTRRAHRILADHFKRKLVEKKYLALVEGAVEKPAGTIDAPIGYDEPLRLWRVAENGKTAETRFRVLRKNIDTTLLELEPVTGRTNQLRAHCAFLGHPIIGDADRGGRQFSRLCLHACRLSLRHPNGGELLEFETGIPAEFKFVDDPNSKG